MGGPLEGLNVLDFGQAGVGPWAASLLGFLGANVLKIERPEGEIIRTQAPFKNGLAVAYTAWNMAKKGAVVDLKDPAGRAALAPLIKQADVITANLRPGVMERLGLGFQEVSKLNPAIVAASSPGWGTSGPMMAFPGGDPDFQAFAGFASLNGDEGGPPEMARHGYHFDLNAAGMFAATILLGLLQRDRTGKGQAVSTSHLGCTLSLLGTRAAEYLISGSEPGPLGHADSATAPHQAFLCLDQRWLFVGVQNDDEWSRFCTAIRREDLLDNPRFATNVQRVNHRQELAAELEPVFARLPSAWWFMQLAKHGVPAGYLNDFETLRHHEHVLANQQIVETDIPHQGKVFVGGLPWRFSKTPARISPAPAPDEHTKEALAQGFGIFGSAPVRRAPNAQPDAPDSAPPLAGIRVVDISQGVAGPYASLLLADAGADVLKIEPPNGDYARHFAPVTESGDSAAFVLLNRNKRSTSLDLTQQASRDALTGLLKEADIFLHDWDPVESERFGFTAEALQALNPGLIACAISPFGEEGPFRGLKGSELVIQAMAEYPLSLGEIGAPPVRWGADIAGSSTGTMAFLSLLAALYHRNRTGEGQRISVSLFGTLLCERQAAWSVLGDVDDWDGPFLRGYYSPRMHGWRTKDNPVYFRLHNASEADYVQFLVKLGLEEALTDERFANAGRDVVGWGKYASEAMPIWERALRNWTAAEVVDLAFSHNSLAIPINTIKGAVEHPQTACLNIIQELTHPAIGKIRVIGPPFQGAWTAPTLTAPPSLETHRDNVLSSVQQ